MLRSLFVFACSLYFCSFSPLLFFFFLILRFHLLADSVHQSTNWAGPIRYKRGRAFLAVVSRPALWPAGGCPFVVNRVHSV